MAQAQRLQLSFIDIFKHPKLSNLATIGSPMGAIERVDTPIKAFALLQQPPTPTDMLTEIAQQCYLPVNKIQDAYPSSPLQEALITLSIKQPGAYIAQHVLALDRSVDTEKLKEAWQRTVHEIDILRTRIIQLRSGAIIQTVLIEDPIEWKKTSSLKEAEEVTLQTHIPSPLGAKLASYTLVDVDTSERYFIWTIHHALYDGWSINLMLQLVQHLYLKGTSDFRQTPYTKFIQHLNNTSAEASTEYWKDNLEGAAPYQFPQQLRISDGDRHGQTLGHNMRPPAHRYTDVTPTNVIRAAWAIVLAAYTGSDDVIFGESLAGRDIDVIGIADVCGPTLTTMPTRVKLDRKATVQHLLQTISSSATGRIPYQHYGLSNIKLIGETVAAACNFQNLLVVQTEDESLPNSLWSVYDNEEQSNFFTYPLVIECKMGISNTEILAHFDINTISSWHVQRLLYQFESVLVQLSSVRLVSDIHVFSEQDAKLIRKWNSYEPNYIDDTIPSMFLRQVAAYPDNIAVSGFDGDLTYAELADLASNFAQEIVKHGAGPGSLIPICLSKSRWAIVAILGVLMSGAAYVPLSSEYPASRHQQIIETCESTIVICSPAYENIFATLLNCIIPVSEATIRQLPACASPIPSRVTCDTPCYVIFTSGSTNIPKGVVIEHQALVSSSAAICKGLRITSDSRVLQSCSFHFDVPVAETLVVLMCGATICIPSEEQGASDLASAITSLVVNWAFLTPSMASTLDGPRMIPTLKTLVVGGEAMTAETINKWATSTDLYYGYRPVEGAVFAIATDRVSTQRDPFNIGHMLKSGRAWLTKTDDPNQLAPVGAVAELCLEGPLLARGYLDDPERTAESFVEHPRFLKDFTTAKVARTYRTGDLVKYMSDGSLRYLGRKDDQIELAGQCIEIGEIEHHLQADSTIRQAIVDIPRSGPCKSKLTAIIRFETSPLAEIAVQPWHTLRTDFEVAVQISKAKLRLLDLVPSHMVPTTWIPVMNVPSLDSTKFDKKQVLYWVQDLDDNTYQQITDLTMGVDAIKTPDLVVNQLQGIWADVLNISLEDVNLNGSWLCKFRKHVRNNSTKLTLHSTRR